MNTEEKHEVQDEKQQAEQRSEGRASIVWSEEYAAHILRHFDPDTDWEMYLVLDRLEQTFTRRRIPFDFNAARLFYARKDIERFISENLHVAPEEVSRRIDEFEETDDSFEGSAPEGGLTEPPPSRSSLETFEAMLRFTDEEAAALINAIEAIALRHGAAMGGYVSAGHGLQVIADRNTGVHGRELGLMAAFLKRLARDTAQSMFDLQTIHRFLQSRYEEAEAESAVEIV